MSQEDVIDAQAVLRLRGDLVRAESRADMAESNAATFQAEANAWRRAAEHLAAELEHVRRCASQRSVNRLTELERLTSRSPRSANMDTRRACYRAATEELQAMITKLDELEATRPPEVANRVRQYRGTRKLVTRNG